MGFNWDYLKPWCWSRMRKCPDSGREEILKYAVQEYLVGVSGKKYEYASYFEWNVFYLKGSPIKRHESREKGTPWQRNFYCLAE
jgi:hypothetical protein